MKAGWQGIGEIGQPGETPASGALPAAELTLLGRDSQQELFLVNSDLEFGGRADNLPVELPGLCSLDPNAQAAERATYDSGTVMPKQDPEPEHDRADRTS